MNKYQYKVQGVDYDVEIVDVEGNIAKVNVNGISFEVEMNVLLIRQQSLISLRLLLR